MTSPFESNDRFTRADVERQIDAYLDAIRSKGYEVVCDERNDDDASMARREINVSLSFPRTMIQHLLDAGTHFVDERGELQDLAQTLNGTDVRATLNDLVQRKRIWSYEIDDGVIRVCPMPESWIELKAIITRDGAAFD